MKCQVCKTGLEQCPEAGDWFCPQCAMDNEMNVYTVEELMRILKKYPKSTKVFIDTRCEFLDNSFSANLADVKFYQDEKCYGKDNGDGSGTPFKALVLEI